MGSRWTGSVGDLVYLLPIKMNYYQICIIIIQIISKSDMENFCSASNLLPESFLLTKNLKEDDPCSSNTSFAGYRQNGIGSHQSSQLFIKQQFELIDLLHHSTPSLSPQDFPPSYSPSWQSILNLYINKIYELSQYNQELKLENQSLKAQIRGNKSLLQEYNQQLQKQNQWIAVYELKAKELNERKWEGQKQIKLLRQQLIALDRRNVTEDKKIGQIMREKVETEQGTVSVESEKGEIGRIGIIKSLYEEKIEKIKLKNRLKLKLIREEIKKMKKQHRLISKSILTEFAEFKLMIS